MNNRFDELAEGLAQSVTRRAALKKFGVGLAGIALACFGLANKSTAGNDKVCTPPKWCDVSLNPCCCDSHCKTRLPTKCQQDATCVVDCVAGKGIVC